MPCYYQGCKQGGITKEHVPPKSFFPKDQRKQLLTVPSCTLHNNSKSSDDVYVLAQICLNTSPANRSREIFMQRVVPQLGYNDNAFRKMLTKDKELLPGGSVRYQVDIDRFDNFFTSLSCGIVYKACKNSLPDNYDINHVYHNFDDSNESQEERTLKQLLLDLYSGKPLEVMNFGRVSALNETVYSVKLFGVSNFGSSITIVHNFFGVFRVTSMLKNMYVEKA